MSDLLSLLSEEDFLQEALLAAGVGFWMYDHARDSIIWSPQMFAMVGRKAGDSPRNLADWFALIHPEDQAGVKASIQGSLDTSRPLYEVQFRYRHRDGNWLWLHSRGRVIRRTRDGSPLLTAGVTNDVSQLKQAESTLEKSETRFSELIEQLPEYVLLIA